MRYDDADVRVADRVVGDSGRGKGVVWMQDVRDDPKVGSAGVLRK